MRTSSSSTILLLATTLHLVTASPPISIIPVPSYIPTIDILPPAAATGTTAAYVALPLTIVPEPDLLAASSVVVVLPAISTLVLEEEPVGTMSPVAMGVKTSVVVEEGWTSTTTVVAASIPFQAPLITPPSPPTSTTTIVSTLPNATLSGKPTGTAKGNGTSGPIETSGGEGRSAGSVIKIMSLALLGVLGIFVFA